MKVIVGMSGGVDSSVAAYLLKKEGWDVIGVLFNTVEKSEEVSKCCNFNAVITTGKMLHIPVKVVDVYEEFNREIIQDFINQYKNGFTPNPCVLCNEKIKFGFGLGKTEELFKGSFFATGHYAIIEKNDRLHLKAGVDKEKDQSYMLWRLKQWQLKKTIFPLGIFTKRDVYKIAEEIKIPVLPLESQDVCFIPGKVKVFLEKYLPQREGEIISTKGKILGKHNGAYFYTVGQRSGLHISHSTPLYVVRIDTEKNIVLLGEREECFFRTAELSCVNFIEKWDFTKRRFTGKPRYHAKAASCILRKDGDKVVVQFDVPQFAVTSGQSLVLYDGDYVFGGGIIKRAY
ncbi:MAG: tRNA 2-thiouridine(34) synthase MnmA [Caldisericota bacterium]|nr:tRNA 2-thiouridine(34) synthase MnmA [Caldisericota bacterium]